MKCRRALSRTAIVIAGVMPSACGAGHEHPVGRVRPVVSLSVADAPNSPQLLSLSGLGTFEGRCPRGAPSWTVRFVVTAGATDTLSYAVGTGARRTVNIQPGDAITIRLVPGAARTHEPADRFVAPTGQGRGMARAMSASTTAPVHAVIYQATEPQTLRADVDLALSTIGGESGQCVLVGSTVHAYTYPNG